MSKKYKIWAAWIFGLILASFIVAFFALSSGSAAISKLEILSMIAEKIKGAEVSTPAQAIIFDLRIPRIILGFMVGGALAISGVIFQGMFKNPLVEPYTLGVSGGAALAVSIAIVSGVAFKLGLPVAGFLGATISIFLVYAIGNKWRSIKTTNLLLTGVMFSFIASALIMLIMAVAKSDQAHGIIFWLMGSLDETNPLLIKVVCVVIPVGAALSILRAWKLNAFSLGEEEAMHLGVEVEGMKRALFALASLMTGVAVSVSGIIAFVGLIVPHFARMAIGTDHRILMPASFFLGGIFLVLCDTLARTIIAPVELPVGVITGIVGGAAFLYFLIKGNK